MSAYFEEGSDAMVALECMVDKVGLANVLYALEHICYAKGEHVQANWQDRKLAVAWNRNAGILNLTASKLARTE